MARTGRPTTKLALTDEERAELKARLAVRNAPADEKLRIRVVLGCAEGESGTHIAQRLKTSIQTVSEWRGRYAAYRFAGLTDALRAGRPRTVLADQVQAVVDKIRCVRPNRKMPPIGACAA